MKHIALLISGLGLLASVLVCVPSSAQEASDGGAALVAKLGDNNFRVRERAQKDLIDTGPAILPAVKKGLASEDAEIRRRCEEIFRIVTHREIWRPTPITMKSEKARATELLAALGKSSGMSIVLHEEKPDPGEKPIKVDFRKTPFWEALKEICDKSNRRILFYEGDEIKLIAVRNDSKAPWSPGVAFVSDKTCISSSGMGTVEEGVGFEAVVGSKVLAYYLPMRVLFEKRLGVSTYFPPYLTWEGKYDNGEKLEQYTAFGENIWRYPRFKVLKPLNSANDQFSHRFKFKAPSGNATKIGKLKVTLAVPHVSEIASVAIRDLKSGKPHKLGRLDVVVKNFEQPSPRSYSVDVEIAGELRFESPDPEVTVLDGAGQRLSLTIPRWTEGENSYSRSYHLEIFADTGRPPAEVRVAYIAKISWQQFEFNFKDLPLPKGF